MIHLFFFFFLFFQPLCFGQYHSQFGQDQYIYEHFFRDVEEGIFVDIGAHDGIFLSNSYFFEKELGWSGLCFEPNPTVFAKLEKNRIATCIRGCVANRTGEALFLKVEGYSEMLSGLIDKYDPRHVKRIDHEIKNEGGAKEIIIVPCYRLNDILNEQEIDHINFLSLDTEGGELEILKSIDFNLLEVDVIAVENNYRDPEFNTYMRSQGFSLDSWAGVDMIFVNKKFLAHTSR